MRLVGEAGPELEFKNRSAYIATHRRFSRLSEVADQVFARPSGSRSTSRSDSGRGNVTQPVNITINAHGASAAEVAALVARQQRRAAAGGLHDGFGV
jgi:C-terminal processing protease CtpA/Prc